MSVGRWVKIMCPLIGEIRNVNWVSYTAGHNIDRARVNHEHCKAIISKFIAVWIHKFLTSLLSVTSGGNSSRNCKI